MYDPSRVDYAKLLDVFWHNVDPLDAGGQFCDRGSQYASAIFARDATSSGGSPRSRSRSSPSGFGASRSRRRSGARRPFYAAEDYHQDYYRKNPLRYHYYRGRCGRDARLEQLWGSAPPSR